MQATKLVPTDYSHAMLSPDSDSHVQQPYKISLLLVQNGRRLHLYLRKYQKGYFALHSKQIESGKADVATVSVRLNRAITTLKLKINQIRNLRYTCISVDRLLFQLEQRDDTSLFVISGQILSSGFWDMFIKSGNSLYGGQLYRVLFRTILLLNCNLAGVKNTPRYSRHPIISGFDRTAQQKPSHNPDMVPPLRSPFTYESSLDTR